MFPSASFTGILGTFNFSIYSGITSAILAIEVAILFCHAMSAILKVLDNICCIGLLISNSDPTIFLITLFKLALENICRLETDPYSLSITRWNGM